jgi:hypothetical protein
VHKLRRKKSLSTYLVILILLTGCFAGEQLPTVEQIPSPTDLATPLIKNVPIPTDTVEASPETPLPEDSIPAIPPTGPDKNIFGVTLQTSTIRDGLVLFSDAGSVWTREDFNWNAVEPNEGDRIWENVASLDTEIIAASERKMQTILILGTAPGWAMDLNHPPCGGRITQAKFGALANFARDLVARYSQPPFNIKYYELWNEPEVYNFLGCWGEPSDPLGYYGGYYYGEMLKVVYPAMKAADPDAQVMVGGLLLDCDPRLTIINTDGSRKDCAMTTFFEGILQSGAGNSFDGISFHAYDYYDGQIGAYSNINFAASSSTTGPTTTQKYRFLLSLLNQYNVTGKFLMNTEIALLCRSCTNDPEFETAKAYYLAQAYVASLADGYRAAIWYSAYGERNSGLVDSELKPFPAFNSFYFTSYLLKNMEFTGSPDLDLRAFAYEFRSPTLKLWAVWSKDVTSHTIELPVQPAQVYRIGPDGRQVNEQASQILEVNSAPVFVLFPP